MIHFDFKAEALAMKDQLVAWRRDFHRHPELAYQEVRTAGVVAKGITAHNHDRDHSHDPKAAVFNFADSQANSHDAGSQRTAGHAFQ